ncbi:TonB-dependent receptor [Dysgonomonas sp. Marseille-P4677]|uniref:SusC/RagA family TonB-linked outer membrane protein n=1 Tax=Dysgonomonas sp. Marseille-P4677 TaxID=2364790 RepID=UPI001912F0E2|nr:TonB-dependent receptor [Dysgonomonas sp. Marseille-P4677]MBK5720291.1 TonB-dependent receptor [Dysgonomonas sp. Marseille-P4677]
MKEIFILLMSILIHSSIHAQTSNNILVEGKILDQEKEVIIGANVVVKGTTNGTTTDIDGFFKINAPYDAVLIISYVGFETQEIPISGKNKLSITLLENQGLLNEVIVIGYGQVKKGDITGSLTTIKPDEMNKGMQVTAQDALIGKVAGVNIVPGDGRPGSTGTIRIRMGASLSATKDPLIVIDGLPVANSAPLSSINPNDIESFTVLKDASATAIYGSRASNGVIIITTKKGSITQSKPNINYSSNYTVSKLPSYYDVLSADEYRTAFQEKANIPEGFQLGTANTDWQKEIYRTAFSMDHNLSISGNTKQIPYRISIGYINQDGILKEDNYQRFSGDIALSPKLLDKHLSIDLNLKGSIERSKPASSGTIGAATFFDPTRPVYENYEGNMGLGYYMWMNGDKPITLASSNPVADLMLPDKLDVTKRSIGSVALDYKIHGFEDLQLHLNLGYDIRRSTYDETIPDLAPSMYTSNRNDGRGKIYWSESENKNYLFNSYINYTKDINDKNNISVMGGYEWQKFWYRNDSETIVKDVEDNSIPDEDHLYLISFFGRLNYSYAQKLLFTATLRADATSRFAPENHWGYFPSAALAYRLTEESFLKGFKPLSDLKLRLSVGQTGQQAIGGYHPYLGTYTISTDNARYLFGNEWVNMYRPNGYDPNIKWETTTTYNVGIDYGFLNNRISGTFDLYKRYTKDLLNEIAFPAGSNFTNSLATNIGNMKGHGFELGINAIPVKTKDFEWSVGGNFTYSMSKITKLNTIDREDSWVNAGGVSRNNLKIHKVGEMPDMFFLLQQAYDDNGKPMEGKYMAKDGSITDVQSDANKYMTGKSSNTPYYYGISTRLNYKDWDLGINGHGSFGNYVFNYQEAKQSITSLISSEKVSSNISRKAMERGFMQEQYFSDYFLENGSFFKIDNITLGYTFRKLWNTSSSMRLAFSAQNVATFTGYSGVDPEIFSGIDNSIYQRPEIYTFSLNLKF